MFALNFAVLVSNFIDVFQGIQQEMKRLNEHIHTLTENVTRMSGNMKYMSALVMSYATAMKEFLNSSTRKSVEVNEQGETSVKNPTDEAARCDISPQSKNTEFTQDTVINKTDVLHNRYEPDVDKLGCDARNPIVIISEIKIKMWNWVHQLHSPLSVQVQIVLYQGKGRYIKLLFWLYDNLNNKKDIINSCYWFKSIQFI